MTIWPMGIACFYIKLQKHTLRICNPYLQFPCGNSFTIAPQYYVVRALSVLLEFNFVSVAHPTVLHVSSQAEEKSSRQIFF